MESGYKFVKVWDPFIRLWHWLLVASVVTGWLLGEFRTFSIMQWHIYCGYLTGILLLLRLIWGFIGPDNVRFSVLFASLRHLSDYLKMVLQREPSAIPGHNPLGVLSVLMLLGLLSIQVVTGLFSEDDGLFFSGPFASELSSGMIVEMTAIHNLVAKLVLIFVLLHVAAILYYLLWKKENLIKAMISGFKLVRTKQAEDGDK